MVEPSFVFKVLAKISISNLGSTFFPLKN